MIDLADKLQKNWKRVSDLWDKTSNNWKDEQHRDFDKNYWQPLTIETKNLIRVSAKLIEVIESARRHVN